MNKLIKAGVALMASAVVVNATPIPVQNASFETIPGGTNVPENWTANQDQGWTEANDYANKDGDRYGILRQNTYWYQDLGVAFEADTTYTVDVLVAHRGGMTNSDNFTFGLFSSDAVGTVLGDAGWVNPQGFWSGGWREGLTENTFYAASDLAEDHAEIATTYSFRTGETAPTGDLVVFVHANNTNNDRAHFDMVSVNAIPEPATIGLMGCAAMGLIAARRFRAV